MSLTLYNFSISFLEGRITAKNFVGSFQELWEIERDSGLLNEDPDNLS